MDLETTRKEIDQIDKELLKLFQDRLQKVLTIAKIKEETGKSILIRLVKKSCWKRR